MAETHNVPGVNRSHVDVLLTNVIYGNIVTASSADGNIYVRRLCLCAAPYNDLFVNCQLFTTCTMSQTSQSLQITVGSGCLCRHSSTHIKVSIFHYSDAYSPVMTLKLEPAVVELEARFH